MAPSRESLERNEAARAFATEVLGSSSSNDAEEKEEEVVDVRGLDINSLRFVTGPDGNPDGTGGRLLTEEKGYMHLGFAFPEWKKWLVLTSIFIVQISMNFNGTYKLTHSCRRY